ncbi:mitochondrial cardiolipin hydrolase-like [Agrilus planipennis]|uniref:Mitochondrial cardiolipin hydrolase n=1 Tax=Agrilus planipennis TaxID=224129 RepID=A0A1W4WUC9_AGRPL|nr:mitochondrial cardiolipin hydrolase-like [Agrilus planipennis]
MFSKLAVPLVISISVTPLILVLYLKNRRKQKQVKDTDCIKCIFITARNSDCRNHLMNNYTCSPSCSMTYLIEILKFLKSAKQTISLCMYMLTLDSVYETLVEAHNSAINVRVIADSEMSRNTSSKIISLKSKGIPVKMQPLDGSLMHHKFCLIDETDVLSGKLFFGSTNLTLQGLSSNWDQIIFTNKYSIIKRFSEEFEYLWQELN